MGGPASRAAARGALFWGSGAGRVWGDRTSSPRRSTSNATRRTVRGGARVSRRRYSSGSRCRGASGSDSTRSSSVPGVRVKTICRSQTVPGPGSRSVTSAPDARATAIQDRPSRTSQVVLAWPRGTTTSCSVTRIVTGAARSSSRATRLPYTAVDLRETELAVSSACRGRAGEEHRLSECGVQRPPPRASACPRAAALPAWQGTSGRSGPSELSEAPHRRGTTSSCAEPSCDLRAERERHGARWAELGRPAPMEGRAGRRTGRRSTGVTSFPERLGP
jgi:hypothetical protein